MAEPRRVKLREPIRFGSEVVEELVIRAATAKDCRRLPMVSGYEFDSILILASRLSGQPDAVIDKLGGDDLEEVIEIVSGFMPGSRGTGPRSSPS